MRLNDAGRMIGKWWDEIPNKFPAVTVDESVVMPNHFHGIIVINDPVGADPVGADLRVSPNRVGPDSRVDPGGTHAGVPLPTVVQWFKTMTTNEYIRGVKTLDWPSFRGKLWLRNYYEHIVRNEVVLNRIRNYIIANPVRWPEDRENPTIVYIVSLPVCFSAFFLYNIITKFIRILLPFPRRSYDISTSLTQRQHGHQDFH